MVRRTARKLTHKEKDKEKLKRKTKGERERREREFVVQFGRNAMMLYVSL